MSAASSEQSTKFPAHGPAVAWGPMAALVVTVVALIGSQLLAGILLVSIYSGGGRQEWLGTTAGQFYFVLLSDALIVSVIWLFLRGRRAQLADLGWSRKPAWLDIGLALLGYLVYFGAFLVLSVVASQVTQINLEQKQELGFDFLGGGADRLMALVSLVILPPIVEETAFRGFLFTGLRKKLSFVWTALITSVIFASLHLLGASDGLLWVAGLDTFVLSLVLCFLREKTGALWAPMTLHALKNAIAFAILLSSTAVR